MSVTSTALCKVLNWIGNDGEAAYMRRLKMFVAKQAHLLWKGCQRIEYHRVEQQEWPADRPLVSVVIPCYNYGMFLREAIESAVAQTFQRTEILVINDGSTDELTKRVLKELCYPRTRIIHQENQGLAKTRNIGAALAAGKYICYLDADDTIEPTYLEKTLGLLESDESLGSCFSWVRCFGDSDSIWETGELDPYFLRQYTTAPSHSVIRREAWEKVRAYNGAGFLSKYNGYFEDWVFWIDLVQCGWRGQVIREPLIRYRVHKNSLGATHRAGFSKMLLVLQEDRQQFFHNRRYRRELQKKLNRRIHVENNLRNLSFSGFNEQNRVSDCVSGVGTQSRRSADSYGTQ